MSETELLKIRQLGMSEFTVESWLQAEYDRLQREIERVSRDYAHSREALEREYMRDVHDIEADATTILYHIEQLRNAKDTADNE